jgi:hypothetical protein
MKLLQTLLSKVLGTKIEPTVAAQPAAGDVREMATTALQQSSPSSPIDITQVLSDLAAKNPAKLNWRESIVDLMKLVGMDSSLSARKELAAELGYAGDTSDSAAMNIWLHKQVMKKIAENGGVVPTELL